MRKTLIYIALFICGLVSGMALADSLGTDGNGIVLEVIPKKIVLSAKSSVEAIAIIQNDSDVSLSDLRLTCLNLNDLNVDIAAPNQKKLNVNGAIAWVLTFSKINVTNDPINVIIRVDYFRGEKKHAISGIKTTMLPIEKQNMRYKKNMIDLEVVGAFDKLFESKVSKGFLIVKNIANHAVVIKKCKANTASFIEIDFLTQMNNAMIQPISELLIPFHVQTKDAVHPGLHTIAFTVTYQAHENGIFFDRDVVKTKDVFVNVLGESEILTLLGVPSLLILPGVLVVITFSLIHNAFHSKNKIEVKLRSHRYWFIAISASIAIGFLYPLLTQLIAVRRNFIEGYGLKDIIWVWGFSILIGGTAYMIWMVSIKIHMDWKNRHVPHMDDTPLQTVKKTYLRIHKENVKIVHANIDGIMQPVCLLNGMDAVKETCWIAPRIHVRWKKSASESMRSELKKLLCKSIRSKKLIGFLQKQIRKKQLEITWDANSQLDGVFPIKKQNIKETINEQCLILVLD